MSRPEGVARMCVERWRRLRLRGKLDRAAAEVRRSAADGELDPRVADRLLLHLAALKDDLRTGERSSSVAHRNRRR